MKLSKDEDVFLLALLGLGLFGAGFLAKVRLGKKKAPSCPKCLLQKAEAPQVCKEKNEREQLNRDLSKCAEVQARASEVADLRNANYVGRSEYSECCRLAEERAAQA